jgi:DNA-binding CsgD family transcriptional regulator
MYGAMTTDSPQISEREREILRLVATGATNQQIAQQLNISINTVKVHLRNIFGKIGAASRTEATVYAIRHGLVTVNNGVVVADALVAEHLASTVTAEARPPAELDTQVVVEPQVTKQAPVEPEPLALPTPLQAVEQPAAPPEPVIPTPTPQARGFSPRYVVIATVILMGLLAAAALGYTFRSTATPQESATANPQVGQQPRWAKRTALPQPRADFAVASYSGDIYVIGGSTANTASAETTRYNVTDNTWTPLTAKPTPVSQVQAVTIGGRVYVPGGESADGQVLNILEAYDTRTQQWDQLPAMPSPRSRYALATVEGKLYLFGGWDGQSYRAEVFAYDPVSKAWSTLAPLPTARRNAGAAIVNGYVFVVGGENENGALRVNERFNPFEGDSGQWDVAEPLPGLIEQPAVISTLNTISVIDPQLGTLHQYSPESETWISKSVEQDVAVSNRAIVLNTSIFVFGAPENDSAVTLSEYRGSYTTFFPNAFSSP